MGAAAAPDLSIVKSHTGNFAAGTNEQFNIAVSNVGTGGTTGTITVSDTLASQFTFVSGTATGWNCSASGQAVTCTSTSVIASGQSAATIPLVVAVSSSASGSVSNTATVQTAGDTNSSNNSSTDTVTIMAGSTAAPDVSYVVPGPVVYAGGNVINIPVTVANDQIGDAPSASFVQADGSGCTAALCGTLGTITGTAGGGSYTLPYTPPASSGFTSMVSVELTLSTSLANSFNASSSFPVYPAGTRVVTVSRPSGTAEVVGGALDTGLTAIVYNDTGATTGATVELLANGYACPPLGAGTTCGTLQVTPGVTTGTTTTGTTGIPFTKTTFSYQPPTSIPHTPYNQPMFLAISKANPAATGNFVFALTASASILNPTVLNTIPTGSAPITLRIGSDDTGSLKTTTWSFATAGASCLPNCGTLSAPTYNRNGEVVLSAVTYTAPAAVPIDGAIPPIVVTYDDNTNINGYYNPTIVDGTCPSGNNGALNGQYAFLVRGAGEGSGYHNVIGSFTADGNGHVTAAVLDSNSTAGGSQLDQALAASTYSIGSNGLGCITIGNGIYRIAVGTFVGSVATKGQLVRFDDYSGEGPRMQGIVLKQDTTSFNNSALSGNYAFGEEGMDLAGARTVVAGLYAADGNGHLTSFIRDSGDGTALDTDDTSGSATYDITDTTTGRGTSTFTDGAVTSNSVIYMINSSEFLSLTTDPVSSNAPLLSGDNRKQTASSFSATSLDSKGYVYYATTIDPSNGGNDIQIGQVQFTTNGSGTLTLDEDDNGTPNPGNGGVEQAVPVAVNIASDGRATISGAGGQPVVYLVGTDSGFFVNNSSDRLGFIQQQTGAPFSSNPLSGEYFVGGSAPVDGGTYDVVSVNVNGSALSGTDDQVSESEGMQPSPISGVSLASSGSIGKFSLPGSGNDVIGFLVSSSQAVMMGDSTSPNDTELFLLQK